MFQKPLLIIGIDPGTTVGYACLDIEGNPIKISSQKELNYSQLIKKLITIGKPLIIGTDKKRIPDFVEKIAIKTGSRIIAPEEDLLVKEKKILVKKHTTKDAHQIDALASSIFAYQAIKTILKKVEKFCEEHEKQKIRNNILELVIKQEMSIKSATYFIEHQDTSTEIVKKVVEKKILSKKDFLVLYDKVKQHEKTIKLLKQQSTHLQEKLREKNKIKPIISMDNKLKKNLTFKNSLIESLNDKVDIIENKLKNQAKELETLHRILTSLNNHLLAKKIENLGSQEFFSKSRILKIDKGDILFVNNPNIISDNVMEIIKRKIEYIIYNQEPSIKIINKYDIKFLNAKDLHIKEVGHFALITKFSFEQLPQNKILFEKVVQEYKKTRPS
ncbi:MAG: DUF460 domain-containing protein [Candidatus Woesearchaeota archaeon]|jgi:hypothetical protein|nr:DUF460 domain-containing protein [Candidatus Woesearchaeota archaeon]MDP7180201.1 DUF460 domain-containing protein [Candidatus Woesearchaeota archaeon]MDP7458134.1 DUF460 domain-containing protein [Candidatus Woesearchaeota archaeon]